MKKFLGGRVMSHPRQYAVLYTVYNLAPECQWGFAWENAGREGAFRPLCPIAPPGISRNLPSVDIFGGMSRGQVATNRRAGGIPWSHQKSLPDIATGEP